MVVELLVEVGRGVLAVRVGLVVRVAAVEDALAVVGPSQAAEFDFFQDFAVVFAYKEFCTVLKFIKVSCS